MASISKNVYIDKLGDKVNKYNNTYHRTIKMKPVDVKDYTYMNFGKEVNAKNPNSSWRSYKNIKIQKHFC